MSVCAKIGLCCEMYRGSFHLQPHAVLKISKNKYVRDNRFLLPDVSNLHVYPFIGFHFFLQTVH